MKKSANNSFPKYVLKNLFYLGNLVRWCLFLYARASSAPDWGQPSPHAPCQGGPKSQDEGKLFLRLLLLSFPTLPKKKVGKGGVVVVQYGMMAAAASDDGDGGGGAREKSFAPASFFYLPSSSPPLSKLSFLFPSSIAAFAHPFDPAGPLFLSRKIAKKILISHILLLFSFTIWIRKHSCPEVSLYTHSWRKCFQDHFTYTPSPQPEVSPPLIPPLRK